MVRNWVERDTNVNLIRMMGFLAASTLTGDVVELSAVSVEEFAADMSFERFGTMGLGGIVLFSMAALFMLTMLLVSLVWRLVWVPVLIIADGLPQVEVQKRHYRRCADEAKGHSSTVNREGLAHSNRKTALDVHGSNRRVDILLSHLKENLSFGFGIARKIGFWLFLNDLWEAAMFPILFLQFFCNRRSGRIDAVLSGDGSSHDPGDRAEVDKHAEAQSQQMKDSDAPNFRQPKSERNCSGEWVVVEEYAGRGEHRER